MIIPFIDYSTEIKPLISGIDVSIDLENIRSSIELAADRVIDCIGQDVWDLALAHYQSSDYNTPGFEISTALVLAIQKALAHFAFYDHFPYLQVRISNSAITRREAEGEKSAYKYQTDAVKDTLIRTAYAYMDKLVKYLDSNATKFTIWIAAKAYTIGNIIYQSEKDLYYRCKTAHTSTADFDTDITNWDILPRATTITTWITAKAYESDDIVYQDEKELYYKCNTDHTSADFDDDILKWDVFSLSDYTYLWQWTESDNYTFSKSVFMDYKEYNRKIPINNDAYLFSMLVPVMDELISAYINPKIDLVTLLSELKAGSLSTSNAELLTKINRYLIYKSFSEMLIRFDYNLIPGPYRSIIDNEMTRQNKDQSVIDLREKLSGKYNNLATLYLKEIDDYLETQKEITENTHTEDYIIDDYEVKPINQNDKFLSTF
jgi:hypothetical protein